MLFACMALGFGLRLFSQNLEEKALNRMNEKHYKEAIKTYQELIDGAQGLKKGEYLKQLAKAYYGDQEHVKAFVAFLQALDALPLEEEKKEPLPSSEEKKVYAEALKIYLDPNERDPHILSLKLRDLYAGIYRLHPDYYQLGYIVAAAYANLFDFNKFFDIFFQSYQRLPHHYLAYKTKSILHIKLYERARTPEEKEKARESIVYYLEKAKIACPLDGSLYRLAIVFASEQDQVKAISSNVKEILKGSLIVPRSDLSFYFDQLLAHGMTNLATDFLAKARKWYPYSRTLDAAEEIIQEKTKE